MNKSERNAKRREYRRKIRLSLINKLGGKCSFCQSETRLEFAHKQQGSNRNGASKHTGSWRYIGNIRDNLEEYILLCHDCHLKYEKESDCRLFYK